MSVLQPESHAMTQTIVVTLDGHRTHARKGASILDTARHAGIAIPTLCHLPGKPVRAACRLCLVRVAGRSELVAACHNVVADGMHVTTDDAEIARARRVIAEMMLAEHGHVDGSHSAIEELARQLGVDVAQPRFRSAQPEPARDLGSEHITVRTQHCVHCDRCIRSCPRGLIARTGRGENLGVTFGPRGSLADSPCNGCGDCVAACPAGALQRRMSEP